MKKNESSFRFGLVTGPELRVACAEHIANKCPHLRRHVWKIVRLSLALSPPHLFTTKPSKVSSHPMFRRDAIEDPDGNLQDILYLFSEDRPHLGLFSHKRALLECAHNIYRAAWLLEHYKAEIPKDILVELHRDLSIVTRIVRTYQRPQSLRTNIAFKGRRSKQLWGDISIAISKALRVSERPLRAEVEDRSEKASILSELGLVGVPSRGGVTTVIMAINDKLISMERFILTPRDPAAIRTHSSPSNPFHLVTYDRDRDFLEGHHTQALGESSGEQNRPELGQECLYTCLYKYSGHPSL
ncbi:hypothetical protein BDN72DRAFT_850829 [Pluteus cervinus]|uniref:Uncharacterized protein n=1 Tax=Pluteus cervinus TaxID=181527 RepID=A0ACD3A420_9AGAR|nr:hypothetical protein BDN72DRAFT_850829 [Pluteus cervinus]